MERGLAIEGCTITRSGDAAIEVIEARPRNRSFPLRLSEGLGICCKVGPAHRVAFEGRELAYPADTLCIRPPGSVWRSDDTGSVGFVSLDIDRSRLPQGLAAFAVTFADPARLPAFGSCVRALLRSRSPADEDTSVAALLADLDAAGLVTADELHVANGRALAVRARAALLDGVDRHDETTLATLARELGTNRFAVMRAFKRAFGIAPHAFRLQLRLERARDRIARGADLGAIAHEIGFADQAHLTRVFKRSLGITPGAYVRAFGPGRALSFKPVGVRASMVSPWTSSPSSPAETGSPPTSTAPMPRRAKGPVSSF